MKNSTSILLYRYILTAPYLAIIIILLIIMLLFFTTNIYIVTACYIVSIFLYYLSRKVIQLNSFLVLNKNVFTKTIYIYQKSDKKHLKKFTCHQIHNLFFDEMPSALSSLKPGRYKTVTQSMFTRAIQHAPNITILKVKKSYTASIQKTQGLLFLKRCKRCKESSCSYRPSSSNKQFYYIDFIVNEP